MSTEVSKIPSTNKQQCYKPLRKAKYARPIDVMQEDYMVGNLGGATFLCKSPGRAGAGARVWGQTSSGSREISSPNHYILCLVKD